MPHVIIVGCLGHLISDVDSDLSIAIGYDSINSQWAVLGQKSVNPHKAFILTPCCIFGFILLQNECY